MNEESILFPSTNWTEVQKDLKRSPKRSPKSSVLLLPLSTTQICCWELEPVQTNALWTHLGGEVLAGFTMYRLNCNWVLRASESEPPSVRTRPFPWIWWPKATKLQPVAQTYVCIYLSCSTFWAVCLHLMPKMGFPGGKEPTCQCRRHKRCQFNPWVGKIPWRRAWQPTAVFLPGEFHGWGSLWATVDWLSKS